MDGTKSTAVKRKIIETPVHQMGAVSQWFALGGTEHASADQRLGKSGARPGGPACAPTSLRRSSWPGSSTRASFHGMSSITPPFCLSGVWGFGCSAPRGVSLGRVVPIKSTSASAKVTGSPKNPHFQGKIGWFGRSRDQPPPHGGLHP